jgi:hypothetical protein
VAVPHPGAVHPAHEHLEGELTGGIRWFWSLTIHLWSKSIDPDLAGKKKKGEHYELSQENGWDFFGFDHHAVFVWSVRQG